VLTPVKKPSKLSASVRSKANVVNIKKKMNWNLEYKKDNGLAKEIETCNNITVIGEYGMGDGFMAIVPSRKTKFDTGIRKFNYYGIVSQKLARRG
jgi:hypothetical protein